MSQTISHILVPTDFTKVADCAVDHASLLATRLDATIHLLHIVDRATDSEEARTRLTLAIRAWVSRPGGR